VRRVVDGSRRLGVYARAGDEARRSRDGLTTAHKHVLLSCGDDNICTESASKFREKRLRNRRLLREQ
jgi:hypothetical protein